MLWREEKPLPLQRIENQFPRNPTRILASALINAIWVTLIDSQ